MIRINKDQLLRVIEARSRRKVASLACQLIRSGSENRELVLAELEFERWLADCCRECVYAR